jgi:hypothetical protein
MTYLDLNRQYVERENYQEEEMLSAQLLGKSVGWDKVLESRCCVIVAPANFGKTTEMLQRVAQMRSNGQDAISVALRQIAEGRAFETSLEADDRAAYRAWKKAPTRTLTVFIDSLDEAAAGKEDDIPQLVTDVADAVEWPNEHVRWVVSTRPAVLTQRIIQDLTELLAKSETKKTTTSPQPSRIGQQKSSTVVVPTVPTKLRIFSMAPLSQEQAKAYLTGVRAVVNAEAILKHAKARGLSGFVTSPGGLDILSRIDLASNPPESLTEVYRRVVSAITTLRGADPRLTKAGSPSAESLTAAAQRLASACQVCQLANIEMPAGTLDIPEKSLSARYIASSYLTERALSTLLTSQLYIDSGYHQVKVYPDELLPFLGAQRLAALVESPDQAERLVEHFVWAAPSGEQGVQRFYLPLMGWLATLNRHCRDVILKKDPQALAFFGDLRNPDVPVEVAREALTQSIERLAAHGDHPGRSSYTLTSENFWQAGPSRVSTTLVDLYVRHKDNYPARDVLTDIATASKLPDLRGHVLARHGADYQKILNDRLDVRYLLALEHPDDLKALAKASLKSPSLDSSGAGSVLRKLSWTHLSARDIANLINTLFVSGRGSYYLSLALRSGGVLTTATHENLYSLARALVVRFARVQKASGLAGYTDRKQHTDLISEVLEVLVERTDASKATRVALLSMVFQRRVREDSSVGVLNSDFFTAVSDNEHVRRASLAITTKRKLDDQGLLYAVVGYTRTANYTAEDVAAVDHPRLAALWQNWHRPPAVPTAKTTSTNGKKPRDDRLTISPTTKKQLTARLPGISNGTDEAALQWIAGWLLHTNRSSRFSDFDFKLFKKAAGQAVANAVRKGFSRLWRDQAPKFDEDNPNTTYHISIAALQGLQLELGEESELPDLSDAEVRRALRYALLEINGYPTWFWRLVEAHPDVATSELSKIASEANNGPSSKEHAEELLASLPSAPEVIRQALAAHAWSYLQNTAQIREPLARRLLESALSVPDRVPQQEFEKVALHKMKTAYVSPLPAAPDKALKETRTEAVVWATQWLTKYPLEFRNSVNAWGPEDPLAVKAFLYDFAAHLGHDRESDVSRVAIDSDRGVSALEDLYLWLRWAVDPAKDVPRRAGVPYTLNAADHAQSFRESLIRCIAAAQSQAAYEALDRIAQSTWVNAAAVEYIKRKQFEMRESQFTRKPLPQIDYERFETDFRGTVTDTLSFAMAVHTDLLAVRYDIERGEHSLRRFFSEIDFARITKPGQAGKEASLALEADFQSLLASELNHHSRKRYSVTVESHTAESKRRDVLCSRNDWRASIELKMSERWTLADYLVALEDQLVGQYMRHNRATVGFLVVVLQKKDRRWTDPETGRWLDFQQVIAVLSKKALAIEASDRSLYLRVIGIDATAPEDFRRAAKPTAKAKPKQGPRAKKPLKATPLA